MYLIFDTETTGLPKDWKAPVTDTDNWPRMVQLAWQTHDHLGNLVEVENYIVKPEGYTIPDDAVRVHGITTDVAIKKGLPLNEVLEKFKESFDKAEFLVGHNVEFDINIVGAEFVRSGIESEFLNKPKICTKETSTEFCALPGGRGGAFKWPNLSELHQKLFGESFQEAHNASADVVATARCFLELIRVGVIDERILNTTTDSLTAFKSKNPGTIKPIELTIESNWEDPLTQLSEGAGESYRVFSPEELQNNPVPAKTEPFVHLHVHSQYSILDGAASISDLTKKAREDGMTALALTDHGNMFGIKEFHENCKKNKLKPILGCEMYVARRSMEHKDERIDRSGEHLVVLAKNEKGYRNLIKLVSIANTKGQYYKPRIDKEVLEKHHEGLIVSTACLGGEIAQKLMAGNLKGAEESISWFKNLFGEDFYLEIMRHPCTDERLRTEVFDNQNKVNKVILELAQKNQIKVIATNDVHFLNAEDADAHDLLICLNTSKDLDDANRMRYTKQEWFKTQAEMNALFSDVPFVLSNTIALAGKVEEFELDSGPIMPDFPIPEGFENEGEYLRHLTYEGAKKRYGDPVPDKVSERLDMELETVIGMGFPGYFLIVQDFINEARNMGVLVGPGRGSAAGAAISYCTGITNIDPIKHDLLFERFLNPDRVSMPDVDIDFDDDGRQLVLDYVTKKYGYDKVAHICTFGTMASKMAIRDVARVLKLPLPEADRIAKMIPEAPKMTLPKAYKENPELVKEKQSENPLISKTIKFAETLEGSVRQTGVHACGILIGKTDLTDHIPVMPTKDEELLTTQFDGRFVESIGLLKMDFLGLKTLSIIKECLENIKLSKGIDIDIEAIPEDDIKTFELFSRGETTAIFQFESPGMKKHLRGLQPNRFEDLVAMNALYRPGPMEYIPSFIARKHGREKIEYDHPMMEEFLKDTYGITVYQEQVMLQSRALGGFTRGESDSLRKAMGKKKFDLMEKLKVKFIEGCNNNPDFIEGCKLVKKKPDDLILKIWKDWEAFASYAFNKSHSVCYARIAYQTGYLKANYPAEFMAANLSRNLTDISKITNFMEECRRMGINVLGPDVNESYHKFTVNKKGEIRFGMAGVKGVGDAAVHEIIRERDAKGLFKDIYDFVERVKLSSVNRKNIDTLAMAGGFDSMPGLGRHNFFIADDHGTTFTEQLVKYGNKLQSEDSAAPNLFGETMQIEIAKPVVPEGEPWGRMETLAKEKELIGIYLSSHPLDTFKFEISQLNVLPLTEMENQQALKGRDICIVGMVTSATERISKNGKPFGFMTLEDYSGTYELRLFSNDYLQFKHFFAKGYFLYIKGAFQEIPWRQNGELEFKIKSMHLLPEVKEEMFSKIQLRMPLNELNDRLIGELDNFTTDKSAKVLIKFNIFDKDENISLNLFSRNKKVNLTQDFINFLEENELEYKVN